MLTLAEWGKTIPVNMGQMQVLGLIEALSDRLAWPLLSILPFMPKQGDTYNANFAGASAQAATRAMNAAFTESTPAVTDFVFKMRAAGGEMKLDINMLFNDTGNFLRASLLTQKLMDIGARLNRMWFTGDRDAGSGAEWHGVNEFCADLTLQVAAGANGAVVTAAMMDDLLSRVPGANVILCNRTLASQIDALGVGVTRTVILNQGGQAPSMFAKNYKGVPILEVLTAPNDTTAAQEEILPFTETQGSSNACSRVTAARIGTNGVYGIQREMMRLLPPRPAGVFEHNDLNWFMAGFCTDRKDSVAQLIGVKAS